MERAKEGRWRNKSSVAPGVAAVWICLPWKSSSRNFTVYLLYRTNIFWDLNEHTYIRTQSQQFVYPQRRGKFFKSRRKTLFKYMWVLVARGSHWATLHLTELRRTLLSYALLLWATHAASFRATLHPTTLLCYDAPCWSTLHPSELRRTLRAALHTIELSCTLLSYAAPYWATLHPSDLGCSPTELRWTLYELRGTSALRSFLTAKLMISRE